MGRKLKELVAARLVQPGGLIRKRLTKWVLPRTAKSLFVEAGDPPMYS